MRRKVVRTGDPPNHYRTLLNTLPTFSGAQRLTMSCITRGLSSAATPTLGSLQGWRNGAEYVVQGAARQKLTAPVLCRHGELEDATTPAMRSCSVAADLASASSNAQWRLLGCRCSHHCSRAAVTDGRTVQHDACVVGSPKCS